MSQENLDAITQAWSEYEKSSRPSDADVANIGKWSGKIVNDLYFPLTKKFDVKAIDAILRGYANMGIDADGGKIKRINAIADEVLADPDMKKMPKDISYSVIVASGYGIKSAREMMLLARKLYDKTIALHKEYDVAKNPLELCAVIEASGASFFFPDSLYDVFFKYSFSPIGNRDFIMALAYSYTKTADTESRPARGIGAGDIYDAYDIGLSFSVKDKTKPDFSGREFQACVRYKKKQSEFELYESGIARLEEKYGKEQTGRLIMPLIGSIGTGNRELAVNKMMYAIDTLKGKGLDEGVIAAIMQSYRL